jgi:hypothetical protein
MTKYYKETVDDFTRYHIVTGEKTLNITQFDDGEVKVFVSEGNKLHEGHKECLSSEALAAFHKFENRCKEIINSTGL